MANNVLVGYSPNDFFYVQAEQANKMPTDSECISNFRVNGNISLGFGNRISGNTSLCLTNPTWDSICKNNFSNNRESCIKRELCNNKRNSTKINNLQNTKSGAMEKYMNEKMNYDSVLMNTINLGIGIIFLIVVIYKNQK
jgi:hypothetical protein